MGLFSLKFSYNLKCKIKLNKNNRYKLIYSSKYTDLKTLVPRLINSTGSIWYTTSRVYFSAYIVINGIDFTQKVGAGVVYEPTENILYDNIEIDPEFIRHDKYFIDSVYVETLNEIPISLSYISNVKGKHKF